MLKLIGDIYIVTGLTVLLGFFIWDLAHRDKMTQHIIGIICLVPGLLYLIWRLFIS